MKDLLVYVADADALGFFRSILNRPQSLKIRPIEFDIERHPQRDSGMVQSGAELARMKKGRYQKALLIWDFHGCGREHKQTPEELISEIQNKLDSFTWKHNSSAHLLIPELEEWLWANEKAIQSHLGIDESRLESWIQEFASKKKKSITDLKTHSPKELFEYIARDCLKRTISPRDFEHIGNKISIPKLNQSPSFSSVHAKLKEWFPE